MKFPAFLFWTCRIVAAIIMLQTLYFKFTGASESVEIFTRMGMEPWGRYGTGFAELVASVLLLINRTAWAGAVMAVGIMGGAIVSHLTILGIEVQGDGGYLFFLAWAVLVCASIVLISEKEKIRTLWVRIFKSSAV